MLYPEGEATEGHGIGHVTSVTWSPTLGYYIALALVAGGRAREAETLVASSPVHAELTPVRVV
ncbi:MAG: glycine cleavage T C-terminal barrel domain-containing protein [Rhodothalassiaceae bacterium]